MSSIFYGSKLKVSIFGESHGEAIGVTIDGFPAGFEVDMAFLENQMNRRRPNKGELTSSRNEEDKLNIISGIFEGKTTGSPICCIIKNNDKKSSDYEKIKDTPRPGHSDYTANIKYKGFNDYRGAGHFSGRLTAGIVFAGALCLSMLQKNYNVTINSKIKSIHGIEDEEAMKNEVLLAKNNLDSVGGIIESVVNNVPVGIGEPFFDSIESRLSYMIFSIPSVKGIEFGEGFNFASLYGSEANDEYYIDENKEIKTYTNNNGGIIGGLTNGMPIVFRTCIKPTPSIAKEQRTVNLKNMINEKIRIEGRHDPCIAYRALPVIDSATAIVILDFILNV